MYKSCIVLSNREHPSSFIKESAYQRWEDFNDSDHRISPGNLKLVFNNDYWVTRNSSCREVAFAYLLANPVIAFSDSPGCYPYNVAYIFLRIDDEGGEDHEVGYFGLDLLEKLIIDDGSKDIFVNNMTKILRIPGITPNVEIGDSFVEVFARVPLFSEPHFGYRRLIANMHRFAGLMRSILFIKTMGEVHNGFMEYVKRLIVAIRKSNVQNDFSMISKGLEFLTLGMITAYSIHRNNRDVLLLNFDNFSGWLSAVSNTGVGTLKYLTDYINGSLEVDEVNEIIKFLEISEKFFPETATPLLVALKKSIEYPM